MTREEAIAELSVLHERLSNPRDCEDGCYSWEDGWYVEAIDMSIEALHREEAEANGWCHRIYPKPIARPTGEWEHLSIKSISRSGVDELQELQCSNCGKWVTTPYMYYPSYHKFCPCCGAMMSNSNEGVDMRGGDDDE